MGSPISKNETLINVKSLSYDQETWKFKLFPSASNDLEDKANFQINQMKSNSQEIKFPTSNPPLIQDIGLFLISEEDIETMTTIQKPQILSIMSYDKSNIENNEMYNLQKNIQTLEFKAAGAFSRHNLKISDNSVKTMPVDANTLFLSQSLIINNKAKGILVLKEMFPNMKKFISQDCQFGNLFIAQDSANEGIKAYLFQEASQFEEWKEKKIEILKTLLEIFNLELLKMNPKLLDVLKKNINTYNLKSLRKEPMITTGFFKHLWQFQIADIGAGVLFNQLKNEKKPISKTFIKTLFKDVSACVMSLALKGINLTKITLSNIFFINKLNLFFFWFPSSSFGSKTNNPAKNPYFINEDNLSVIQVNSFENVLEDRSLLDVLDFGTYKRNATLESLQMSQNWESSIYHNFHCQDDLKLISNNYNNENIERIPLTLEVKPLYQNIEILGLFLKYILELTEFDNQPTLSFINHINEEIYFTFFQNYFLNFSNLQIHKARNFLHFFLDKNKSQRIDLLGLIFYLDHNLLKPWKYFNFSQTSFISLTPKTATFQNSNGSMIYEGEFRVLNDKKCLQGKGILKNSETGELIYEGYWKQNKFHGKGSFYIFGMDSYIYKGEFREGRCHGEGIIYYKNKMIYKGLFSNNNYYNNIYEPCAMSNDILEDNCGCLINFEDPIKVFEGPGEELKDETFAQSKNKKLKEFMGMIYEENQDFEINEINLLNVKPKEQIFSKICEWITKKMKGLKHFIIVHCLKDENVWVVDGFDVMTLHAKLRIYISKKPLNVKSMILLLKGLKDIFEDFAVKLWQPIEEIESSEMETFIEELSLKLFSFFKLKKLDFLGNTSFGQGFRGKEICEKMFTSFIFHKMKRIDLKASNLTDDFFEIMKKSPYLSSLDDILIKNCRKISETGFLFFSELRSLNSLRSLSIVRTSITNESLLYLSKSEFCECLEKLNLSQNWLLDDSGFSEFFRRTSMKLLKKLYISWNRLTDVSLKVLFEASQFISLKKIKLVKCPVFDVYSPDEFSNLKMLCKLDLSKTLLTKPNLLNLITRYPNLKILQLAYCQRLNIFDLSTIIQLSELKNLKKIDLSGLHILPAHIEYFLKNSSKLSSINFKKNPLILNQTVFDILKTINPRIFEMNFSNTLISDEAFEEFSKSSLISELRNLYLKRTRISDKTISVLFEKGVFPQLRILDVSWTEITNGGVEIMANNLLVAKLYDLSLKGCSRISVKGINLLLYYYPNSYLKRLNLSNLNLTNDLISHKNFFHMKGLMKLIIKNSQIETNIIKKMFNRRLDRKAEKLNLGQYQKDSKGKEEIFFEDMFENELDHAKEIKMLDFSNFINIKESFFLINITKLKYFENLKEMNLENCLIGDKLISSICNSKDIQQMEKFNLSKTEISDHGLFLMSVSSNFKNLIRLELRECNITDSGALDILRSLIVKIEYLDLTLTKVSNVTLDCIMQGLERGVMENLKEIWVYFCPEVNQEKANSLNKNFDIFCYF